MPAGMINCVTGMDALGSEGLTGDSRVRKGHFTGSTQVGKILYRQCADSVKKLSLELGGAPFIVFDDADLDAADNGAMLCKFRNAGQHVCANRILVQSGIHDRFVEAVEHQIGKVADGKTEGSEIGPLINADGKAKVETHVDARCKRSTAVCGGSTHDAGPLFILRQYSWASPKRCGWPRKRPWTCCANLPLQSRRRSGSVSHDTPYGLAAYLYRRLVTDIPSL